jgi:hypothetical protein
LRRVASGLMIDSVRSVAMPAIPLMLYMQNRGL